MRVLFCLHGFPPELSGGTERAVQALGTAMQARGHQVTVVAGTLECAPCERVDAAEHQGLRVLRMHRDDLHFESWFKAWSPGVSDRFARLCADERPDVVHVHHWLRLTSDLVRVARDGGAVTAVTLHDYYTALASPVRRVGDDQPVAPASPPFLCQAEIDEAFAHHRADFVDEVRAAHLRFAPSAAHADGLRQMAAGRELGPILTAPPPLLAVPARHAQPTGPRGKRLLCWGTIYPDKGIDLVLDALASIGSGFALDVLGEAHDEAYREALAARAATLPVTFHGAFDAAKLASIDADYAILPSMCHESYGLVLDEAQCLGLPILAADLPAYREHAPDGACAFFAPADPGELAMLLLDEARLQALRPPDPPAVVTPSAAADELLARYDEARAGAHGPCEGAPLVTDRDRARALFRRAERRLWTALQQERPSAPPDGFLGTLV